MKFFDVIKALCVCGCVFGCMCEGTVGVNSGYLSEQNASNLAMYTLHSQLIRKPKLQISEWRKALNSIQERIDFLIKNDIDSLLHGDVGELGVALAYAPTFDSLCEFCRQLIPSDSAWTTLSKLFLLLSKASTELNNANAVSISGGLLKIADDISIMSEASPHPLLLFADIAADEYNP